MNSVVVQHQPLRLLAGFSFFGDPFHSHAGWTEENEIGRLWQRLMTFGQIPESQEQALFLPKVGYELHIQNHETPKSGEFEVFVGLELLNPKTIDQIPVELCLKVLPATQYALFTLPGNTIHSEDQIVESWMKENNYELTHTVYIQRYDERFKGMDKLEESIIEILVPVHHAGPIHHDAD